MQMKNRILLLLALSLAFAFQSCFKVEETIATVRVLNEAGQAVPSAEVTLLGGNRFNEVQTTNGSGVASFNFTDQYQAGQSGFAVLDITVIKGSQVGTGIIKIEEQETTEETIVIE